MEQHTAINIRSLLELIDEESRTPGPKVTIYFSVPQSSDYAIIGRGKLKADIHATLVQMQETKTPHEVESQILSKLSAVDTPEFWKHRSEGYAIFASPGIVRYYALPLPVQEGVHVGSDFHVTPLIELLSLPEHFYLLELSLATPRMVRVHPQYTVPVSLDAVWALEAEWDQEDFVHDRAFHTSGSARAGHHGTIPSGGEQDHEFRRKERYIAILADTVDEALKTAIEPLVVSGPVELISHFRKHLRYGNVLISHERIPVSPSTTLTVDAVPWRESASLFEEREAHNNAIERELEELRGKHRVTDDAEKILSFSAAGKVMTLLVDTPLDGESKEPDLINAALVMTLRHRGSAVPSKTGRSNSGMTALLRAGTIA